MPSQGSQEEPAEPREHDNDQEEFEKPPTTTDRQGEEVEKANPDKSQRNEPRSENFDVEWEPFRDDDDLELQRGKVTGPVSFMDPTHAIYTYTPSDYETPTRDEGLAPLENSRSESKAELSEGGRSDASESAESAVQYKWTSRNNRKGRHALIIYENDEHANPYSTPPTSRGYRPVLKGIWRMLTVFTIHDISYLLAVAFTIACTILVINAILTMLPYTNPDQVSATMPLYYVQSLLGAIGSSLFFVGSLTSFSEAVNTNRRGCFGWKLQRVTQPDTMDTSVEDAGVTLLVPDGRCRHHHDSYRIVAGHPESWQREVTERKASSSRPEDPHAKTKHPWIWLPSLDEVRSHLRYDYGFVTAFTLACSSFLYCCMGWAALATTVVSGEVASWIRIPQIIAAAGFTAACLIATIETQREWWRPSIRVIGWHASLFNTIGSVGFLLTAVFGYQAQSWAQFQFGSSYLWGEYRTLLPI